MDDVAKEGASTGASWRQDLIFFLQTSRPGFWITSIWFYLLPVARMPVFDSASFWLGLFYVTFPLGLLIYGCNDLVDVETDRFNARKGTFLFGARGTIAQLRRLPTFIVTIQLVCLIFFWWWKGPRMLVWFGLLLGATALYNWPGWGFKNHPFVDMLNQIGYLLVFDLAVVLNQAASIPWATWVFGALFAMHSHLLGQIMDAAPDRLAGRRSTAVVLGVVRAKFLLAVFLLVEAGLVAFAFQQHWVAAAFAGGAAWFVVDGALFFRERPYPTQVARWFLSGWNVVAVFSAWWIWSSGALSQLGG